METGLDSSTQIKNYVDIAWRRKWWILVPTVLAGIASLVIIATTPKVYRATTTILVTRQSVPEEIVRSTVTLRVEERMRSLQVQILSRSYLEQIAREFDMIPAGAREADIEGVYQKLRAQIIPEVDRRDFSWFRISVEDVEPERAAGIANRLAGLFIEQNSKMRASQATGTLEATEGWETKYRLELAKRDQAIAEFKRQNTYELPDQQTINMQLLSSAQIRVTQLTSDIQSFRERLDALQTQRASDVASAMPDDLGVDDVRLASLQRQVDELLETYTEDNPLVKRKRDQIAELVQTLSTAGPSSGNRTPTDRLDPRAMQIVEIESTIRSLERDRARENASIGLHRARLASAPLHQQRLTELTRDYETVKQQFDTVVAQKEQAQRAQDLEESKKGEQFQIQDRAYPPPVPFKPDPFKFLMVGLGLGLALGVGATAARELIDQTIRSEDEMSACFLDLPIYGVIPNLDAHSNSSAQAASSRVASP